MRRLLVGLFVSSGCSLVKAGTQKKTNPDENNHVWHPPINKEIDETKGKADSFSLSAT